LDVWRFHFELALETPKILLSASEKLITWPAVILFLIGLFNPEIVTWLIGEWAILSRWWSVVPLALLFLHGLLKGNKARFDELRRQIEAQKESTKPKLVIKVATEKYHLAQHNHELTWSGGNIHPAPDVVDEHFRPTEKVFRLRLYLYVRFHNKDIVIGRVDHIDAEWVLAGGEVIKMDIEPLLAGHRTKINGLRIEPRQETDEYVFIVDGKIDAEKRHLLNDQAYVRLVMRADGQAPYYVALDMDWEEAWQSEYRVHAALRMEGECTGAEKVA
jgi:hypothetical protein